MDEWKDDAYLVHHGILGQKWGVRRFQNSDGSLTAAGRVRYGIATVPGTERHPYESVAGGGFVNENQLQIQRDELQEQLDGLTSEYQALKNIIDNTIARKKSLKAKLSKIDHRSPEYSVFHRRYVDTTQDEKTYKASYLERGNQILDCKRKLRDVDSRIKTFYR